MFVNLLYKLRYSTVIILLSSCVLFSQEGGYVDHYTSAPGETVKFYISTSKTPFTLSIYKIENEDNLVTQFTGLNGGIQAVNDSAYYYGCKWNVTYSLTIPADWKPGAYRAVFPTSDSTAGVIFFVTSKTLGSYSKILFVSSTNTWNAYNFFGGKSMYGFNSTNGESSNKVSYLRPNWYPYGSLDFYSFEREVIAWMARNKWYPEFISDTELHYKNDVLKNYDLVVIAGHSEYWSNEHRWQFEKYMSSGGKLIILAGASCWSQVRFEGDKMVKYSPVETDPLFGVTDSLVTGIFNQPPLNWPENHLTGVSGEFGGYVNHNKTYVHADGYGDYAAYNTHHWIFRNTGLKEGEEYGYESEIVGNENDGAEFRWNAGIPSVTGANGTPMNFRILSLSPAKHYKAEQGLQGWAVMGMFYNPSGGAVFNASSIRWAWGLGANRFVQVITKNVFEKFLNEKYPPDIVSWSPSVVDSAVINKIMQYQNRRDFLISGSSLNQTFTVQAEGPYGTAVNYAWLKNGVYAGTGTSFKADETSLFQDGNKYSVKVLAYNDKDTTSIAWNYFNTQLAFSSDPVTKVKPGGTYIYPVQFFNSYKDALTVQLVEAPTWLTMDGRYRLAGRAPAQPDSFKVSIKVTNKHSQTAVQDYTLYVTDQLSDVNSDVIPGSYSLDQNYPNPFNPSTTISYALPAGHKGNVSLKIFDVAGKEIAEIVNEAQEPGVHSVTLNTAEFNMASGIYFYTLRAGEFSQTKKLALVK